MKHFGEYIDIESNDLKRLKSRFGPGKGPFTIIAAGMPFYQVYGIICLLLECGVPLEDILLVGMENMIKTPEKKAPYDMALDVFGVEFTVKA